MNSEDDEKLRHFLKQNQVDPDEALKKMIKDAKGWKPPHAKDLAPKMFEECQGTSTTEPLSVNMMRDMFERVAGSTIEERFNRSMRCEPLPPSETCDGCSKDIYGSSHREENERFTKCPHCGLHKISRVK